MFLFAKYGNLTSVDSPQGPAVWRVLAGRNFAVGGPGRRLLSPRRRRGWSRPEWPEEVLRSVWIYWTLRRLGNGLDVPGKEGTARKAGPELLVP